MSDADGLLDPEAAAFLRAIEGYLPRFGPELSVAALRAVLHAPAPPSPHVLDMVRDEAAPGPEGAVPIRLYRAGAGDPVPVLVWLQGGGLVTGTLDTADAIARDLAVLTGYLVVSVAPRLIPEHPFPAPMEDAAAAVQHVLSQAALWGGDGARVAVGGESSGASLALIAAYMARDRGWAMPAALALVSPTADRSQAWPSARTFADGPILSGDGMAWFTDLVHPGGVGLDDELAAPLNQTDHRSLPPALILTMAVDPTRDGTEALAAMLKAAGNDVTLRRIEGLFHGAFGLPLRASAEVRAWFADWLRARFRSA